MHSVQISSILLLFLNVCLAQPHDVLSSNQLRQSPDDNITIFCLHPARKTLIQVLVNDPEIRSKVDSSLPMALLIHGWMDSFFTSTYQINGQGWTMATVQAWVDNVQTNVCGVDWSDLSKENYFRAALLNTHIVGNVVGNFVNYISLIGISPSVVTIAGHSLGAHIAGFVGKDLMRYVGQRLGRIIGLDPAGPLFTFPILAPPENILTANDAVYVQTIHTSVGTYGASFALGNADFYANNGFFQPGCLRPLNPGTLEFAPFLCSHFRSTAYFQSSLNRTHIFRGTTCGTGIFDILDVLGIRPPSCVRPRSDLFGVYSQQIPGRFNLRTTDDYPYCSGCIN